MKIHLIILCLLAAALLNSCSSTTLTSVSGYVKDRDGRPIEGAEITLAPASSLTDPKVTTSQTKSGVNGFYSMNLSHDSSEKLVFTVRKKGFSRIHTQNFSHDEAPKGSNDVVLD